MTRTVNPGDAAGIMSQSGLSWFSSLTLWLY